MNIKMINQFESVYSEMQIYYIFFTDLNIYLKLKYSKLVFRIKPNFNKPLWYIFEFNK
jgi:hypothetical protein